MILVGILYAHTYLCPDLWGFRVTRRRRYIHPNAAQKRWQRSIFMQAAATAAAAVGHVAHPDTSHGGGGSAESGTRPREVRCLLLDDCALGRSQPVAGAQRVSVKPEYSFTP